MREIKFRLVKDGKIVGYEKHTQNKGNFKSSIFHSVKDDCDLGYEWNNIVWLSERVIDCDYKEQYTGLKDKNGKEIYEGDIPKSYSSEKHAIEYGEYSFEDNDGQCSIKEKKIGWHYGKNELTTIYGDWDIEIIGNIHEEIV